MIYSPSLGRRKKIQKGQVRNNPVIWGRINFLPPLFWKGIDPEAVTTFPDIASLS